MAAQTNQRSRRRHAALLSGLLWGAIGWSVVEGPRAVRADDIFYTSDFVGRLSSMREATTTTVYQYDAVGNLLGIARFAASQTLLLDFAPASGPPGTVVTLQATGLSPIPTANVVTFNSLPSTVVSLAPPELIVRVPLGATTGPVMLSTPSGSSVHSVPFEVADPEVDPPLDPE